MAYLLYYWPGLPGRGEFVRLAMEAAEIPYTEPARDDGVEALLSNMKRREKAGGFAPFAPPYLVDGDFAIAQVAHILTWLGDRHGLGANSSQTDLELIQLQLTVTDMVAEVHNVHHPVGGCAYYEDQKEEAIRAASQFREQRIPKFLSHFERAAAFGDGPFVLGGKWTHVDSSLALLIDGLHYMFPKRLAAVEVDYPRLHTLRDAFMDLPAIAAYRASDRCQDFNEDGIFRHYPELDAA